MSKPEWAALALSIIAVVGGVVLAFALHDGMSFSRSGAVVCIIAVFFAYQKIPDRLVKEVPGFLDEFLPKEISEAIADRIATEEQVKRIDAETRKAVGAKVDETIKRLLRLEASLLVAGTIIWGFGDIPFNQFWSAGTCLCSQTRPPPPVQPARSSNRCRISCDWTPLIS